MDGWLWEVRQSAISPKFEKGLKEGKYVHKTHYLCPWNTRVLYGEGHGNLGTGCSHSCSIRRARYLETQEIRDILTRFKTRLQTGAYDCMDHMFVYRLCGESGYVVDTGLRYLENLRPGDRLKDHSVRIYNITSGESYTFRLSEYVR